MRLLHSNSATSNGTGQRRTYLSFRQALIFAAGGAFGSILVTLIGLEYTSWVIIAVCSPMALVFGMLEQPRERHQRTSGVAPHWYSKVKRSAPPPPGRPPRRPTTRGLHRVK